MRGCGGSRDSVDDGNLDSAREDARQDLRRHHELAGSIYIVERSDQTVGGGAHACKPFTTSFD